jgi:cytochrome c5
MKCNVWCCSSTTDVEEFVGEFCEPCHKAVTTGIPTAGSTAWFEQLRNRLGRLDDALVDIQNLADEARGA